MSEEIAADMGTAPWESACVRWVTLARSAKVRHLNHSSSVSLLNFIKLNYHNSSLTFVNKVNQTRNITIFYPSS